MAHHRIRRCRQHSAGPEMDRQLGAARAEEVIERPAPVYATCRLTLTSWTGEHASIPRLNHYLRDLSAEGQLHSLGSLEETIAPLRFPELPTDSPLTS